MMDKVMNNKHIAVLVIGVIVLIVAFAVTGIVKNGWASEEAVLSDNIERTKADVDVRVSAANTAATQAVVDANGASLERIDGDIEIVEKLAETLTTWGDYETYMAARNSVIEDYGISKDSWVLKEFMPEVVVETDNYGHEQNIIDMHGYNMILRESDTRCVGFDGDKYRYMTLAETASDFKGSLGSSMFVLFITVDGKGNVSDVDGMAVSR